MINEPLYSDEKSALNQSIYRDFFRRWWWLILLILVISGFLINYFSAHRAHEKPAFPVVSAIAHHKKVPIYISALGNVTPTYTVTVKTQINGLLMKVHFKEGQWVHEGDLLADIDQRPLLAQL